jgi:hypothetical protein
MFNNSEAGLQEVVKKIKIQQRALCDNFNQASENHGISGENPHKM